MMIYYCIAGIEKGHQLERKKSKKILLTLWIL